MLHRRCSPVMWPATWLHKTDYFEDWDYSFFSIQHFDPWAFYKSDITRRLLIKCYWYAALHYCPANTSFGPAKISSHWTFNMFDCSFMTSFFVFIPREREDQCKYMSMYLVLERDTYHIPCPKTVICTWFTEIHSYPPLKHATICSCCTLLFQGPVTFILKLPCVVGGPQFTTSSHPSSLTNLRKFFTWNQWE